jgi:TRAP-type uncharacterized transport system substrate-binding protein
MLRPFTLRPSLRDWIVAGLSAGGFLLAAIFLLQRTRQERFHLTLSAGSVLEMRHQIAQRLAREARQQGIEIELKASSGSEESFEKVNGGVLDLALAQGGLSHEAHRNVRQVTGLYLEPMHLLVKQEIYPEIASNLDGLKGKRININTVGSGTHYLALETLQFAGLAPGDDARPGDFIATTLSQAQLEAETDYKQLPDAVFLVTTMPSRVARHLVQRHGYRLVALPFGEAFSLDAFTPELRLGQQPALGPNIDKMQVYNALIPAYTYDVEPAVPAFPIQTLGTRLLLVARKDVDAAAVAKLLDVVFNSGFAYSARPQLSDTLLQLPPELPLHAGTLSYMARNKPLITGDVVDFLEKAVTIGAPLLGALLFFRQWIRQRTRRLRDEGFEHYIFKVTEIERKALQLEMAATLKLRELLPLQQELGHLKSEALARFVSGKIEGEELISGFLTHVNDTRNYLARLVLHVRDNLEEEAQLQGRPLRELWKEALGEQKELCFDEPAPAAAADEAQPPPPELHQNLQDPVQST